MNVKKDQFLITGGSGFLGINLIRYLLKTGVSHIRSLDIVEFNYPEKSKIEVLAGDIRDIKTVRKAMQGVDFVIHCAAALPLYSKDDIFTTEVDGSINLLEEALKEKIEKFIFISSTAVYGVPDHHPVFEADRLIGVGPYGQAKIMAEKEVERYRQKGLTITTLRPKSFVGPERLGVFALLYDWAQSGRGFPVIGSGNNRYQLLDVEDLCRAIWICCQKDKKVVNDTFNIGAEKFSTMKQDFQVVLDQAGFGKKIVPLPAGPIILVLKALEAFKLSPLYEWVYNTAGKDSFVSTEKAKKNLDFQSKFSNQQALLRNYQWYLNNLDGFQKTSGVSHRVPWKQGILSLAKLFF